MLLFAVEVYGRHVGTHGIATYGICRLCALHYLFTARNKRVVPGGVGIYIAWQCCVRAQEEAFYLYSYYLFI